MEGERSAIESQEVPKRAVIVSGFPGIGKTSLFQNPNDRNIVDSDSTPYSWKDAGKRERNPDWPANYIADLESKVVGKDAVLVSTHKEVRDALVATGLPFTLVYPSLEMKDEYIQRYIDRGSD